jgi:GntR family transcriptional regulator/MocR family aminotransferase
VEFKVPEGGMAVWTRFDQAINLADLAQKALKKDFYLSNGLLQDSMNKPLNATRLGFASSNEQELETCIEIIAKLLKV